jgi:hypothetical protein
LVWWRKPGSNANHPPPPPSNGPNKSKRNLSKTWAGWVLVGAEKPTWVGYGATPTSHRPTRSVGKSKKRNNFVYPRFIGRNDFAGGEIDRKGIDGDCTIPKWVRRVVLYEHDPTIYPPKPSRTGQAPPPQTPLPKLPKDELFLTKYLRGVGLKGPEYPIPPLESTKIEQKGHSVFGHPGGGLRP